MDRKCVIVTGAARGIGLATTKLFLDQGWRVVMVDRDAAELGKSNALEHTLRLPLDISDPEQVEMVISQAKAWAGRIDSLINNAGVAEFGPVE